MDEPACTVECAAVQDIPAMLNFEKSIPVMLNRGL